MFTVQNGQLIVQGPVVINVSDEKKTSGEEVEDSCEPFAHVKPVNPQNAQKREQNPCYIVIVFPALKRRSATIHGWNQKEIRNPADEKQPRVKNRWFLSRVCHNKT
jgi:hypothetical protein